MTDISIHYYNNGWQDLTAYAKNFKIEDYGITKVPTVTVTLEGLASNLSTFMANMHRLIRIRANQSGWQTLFYGYVDNPFLKTFLGMSTDMRKISLDCVGAMQRLAVDNITFDYYKLQSAITPLADANAWTFRKMIQDFLTYPDSEYDTGFDVVAAIDANGIDHIIDASCSWNKHSLLDAVRTVCDRIGYDGYLTGNDVDPFELRLFPFNKASTFTLAPPFVKEPEYDGGSLNDMANIIKVWGGVDAGIPSDGDRWTEWAMAKYSPAIWSAARSGATTNVIDINNTVFTDVLRVNTKCLEVNTTGSLNAFLLIELHIPNTEYEEIDAKNRMQQLVFNIMFFKSFGTAAFDVIVFLTDSSNNKIKYRPMQQGGLGIYEVGTEVALQIPLNTTQILSAGWFGNVGINNWYYHDGTTFDWEHVVKMEIQIQSLPAPTAEQLWGVYIDGVQFIGGKSIDPFQEPTLNPPIKSQDSINQYGVHYLPYQDTTISSFEQAQTEGARLLNNLKNPIPMLTISKQPIPTTQLYPSNVVTVLGVDYRIQSIIYEWDSNVKDVTATYKLVSKTSPLPPIWTIMNELRYLVK